MEMGDSLQDAYADAKFTAEISTRMQVPDRILLDPHNPDNMSNNQHHSNGISNSHHHHHHNGNNGKYNDLGMRRRDPRLDMQVPDRILLAGGNTHVASKSTPRELQLENAILPPTPEHVRVTTPPRSIRLDEHSFPAATDDESSSTTYEERYYDNLQQQNRPSSASTTADVSESHFRHDGNSSLALINEARDNNLTTPEELQLLRRQLAKINHRLMAVELENQQQQSREMILTVLVSAYLLGKVFIWLNRSL